MKIIIVGDGKVGNALSESLSKEGHDITIIDRRTEVLKKSVNSLDVIAMRGNGASSAVQKQAEWRIADLLIAAPHGRSHMTAAWSPKNWVRATHRAYCTRNTTNNESYAAGDGLSMV